MIERSALGLKLRRMEHTCNAECWPAVDLHFAPWRMTRERICVTWRDRIRFALTWVTELGW